MLDLSSLPNDPETLKQIIADLVAQIQRLQAQMREANRARFGPRSERSDPAQLQLFQEQLDAVLGRLASLSPKAELPPSPKPNGHGRKAIPNHLPRKRIEYDLPAPKKTCSCGKPLRRIGEEVTQELEYVPASIVVRELVRVKYACPSCQETVRLAEMPPRPIEKGLPGPGLLAYVATSKYADHLPLYRLEDIFARNGLDVRRSTLSDWVEATAELLSPIVHEMERDVLESRILQTDDTPVRVQDDTKEHATREGRFWGYLGHREHPHVVFRFTPNHSALDAQMFLANYIGILQADAYKGYDKVYALKKAIEAACWAHARRYFEKTLDAKEKKKPSPNHPAHAALAFIRRLYQVEDQALGLDPERRKEMRQRDAKPVLDEFRKWLEAQSLSTLPQSPMGEAIGYTLGNWKALLTYLEDGEIEIDNNAMERALRGVAVGRKNWLFVGSDRAGHSAAVLMTLVATCKRHAIDPFAYFRDVIVRVLTLPLSRVAELMPHRWKAAQASVPSGTSPPARAP